MINKRKIDFNKIIKEDKIINKISSEANKIYLNNNIDKKVPLGERLFEILEKEKCIMLFYPIKDENAGMFIERYIGDEKKHFVFINTERPYTEQIFTAAHEFGHYKKIADVVKCEITKIDCDDEDIIDRYAAEILMPKETFIDFWNINSSDIKEKNKVKVIDFLRSVVYQMITFKVSFAAIMLRFAELDLYAITFLEKVINIVDDNILNNTIQNLLKESNSNIDMPTLKKYITNLYKDLSDGRDKLGEEDINIKKLKAVFEINGSIDNELINEKIEAQE